MACDILVPIILVSWPGIKPTPPALEAQSINQWATREVPEKQVLPIEQEGWSPTPATAAALPMYISDALN